jgi:hypothetical protein
LGESIKDNMVSQSSALQDAQARTAAIYDQLVGAFGNAGPIDRSNDVMLAAGPGYGGMGGRSQRDGNIARMLDLANRADPGSVESLRQPDGSYYRVEVTGVGGGGPTVVGTNAQGGEIWSTGASTYPVAFPDIVATSLEPLAVAGTGLRLGALAQGRAEGQGYYNDLIANADNPFTAIGATYGRAFNNAGYDLADGAVGLYSFATDSAVRTRVLGGALDALSHPIDTGVRAYTSTANYLSDTSGAQIAEDVLRFGAGGVASMGVGRGATALGGAAVGATAATEMAATDAAATFRANFVGPTIGRSGFISSTEFADASYLRYQGFVNEGYDLATAADARGTLVGNANTRIGSYVDRYSATSHSEWLGAEGVSEGPDGMVQANRWLRDPSGSGLYVRPDIRIPGAGLSMDATVGLKWSTDTQIMRFSNFSGGDRISIVRPQQLGGSYSIWP